MIRPSRNAVWLLPALALAVTAAGCTGGGGITVSGKLIMPKGVEVKDTDSISVNFFPEVETKKTYGSAPVNPSDLTFSAKEMVPGKYYVSVSLIAYPGPDQPKRQAVFDPIIQQFKKENKKLTYEVTNDSSQTITIDLGKATVTKG